MKVAVIEKRTGKVVARYPITPRDLNYEQANEKYFTGAWESAVEDGVGTPDNRKRYTLKFFHQDKRHEPV
jgi:hypothetical protein